MGLTGPVIREYEIPAPSPVMVPRPERELAPAVPVPDREGEPVPA